jgi:hypothetical protein
MIRSKADVEFHSEHGRGRPAVNVKVDSDINRVALPLELGQVREQGESEFKTILTEPEFTHDWIRANVDEETLYAIDEDVRRQGWEQAQQVAEEVFGSDVKVYSQGRSGGWAVVDGIDDDVEGWDAIQLAKWRTFSHRLGEIADDIPRMLVESIYSNEFQLRPDLADLGVATTAPALPAADGPTEIEH